MLVLVLVAVVVVDAAVVCGVRVRGMGWKTGWPDGRRTEFWIRQCDFENVKSHTRAGCQFRFIIDVASDW